MHNIPTSAKCALPHKIALKKARWSGQRTVLLAPSIYWFTPYMELTCAAIAFAILSYDYAARKCVWASRAQPTTAATVSSVVTSLPASCSTVDSCSQIERGYLLAAANASIPGSRLLVSVYVLMPQLVVW